MYIIIYYSYFLVNIIDIISLKKFLFYR